MRACVGVTSPCVQLVANEVELIGAGISQSRLDAARVDLQHRVAAANQGALAWGVFTARKRSNATALIVGAGPVGACVAMRMSQSGVANVTLKALPSAASDVLTMARLAGVSVVDDWDDLVKTHWGSVIVAVKTHWLPAIALDMECTQVRATRAVHAVRYIYIPKNKDKWILRAVRAVA